MATEVYVRPLDNDNNGDGSSGDPYGDLQFALDQYTAGGTGHRFNISDASGVDEILTAALSLATYGAPTLAAPLIFQGYTSSVADGGIGGIDGNATYTMFASGTVDYVKLYSLHLHNTGSAALLTLDNNIDIVNCELDNTSSHGINIDADGFIAGNYIHNIGGQGINMQRGVCVGNVLKNGTNDFTDAIFMTSSVTCMNNILSLDGTSDGISFASYCAIRGNSIWSNAGTGHGILPAGAASIPHSIVNNIVEGFSGVSGVGIELSADDICTVYGANSVFNCADDYDILGVVRYALGDNETPAASVFADAVNDDFTVNTDMKEGGWPLVYPGISITNRLDKGAVQRVEPAGGGGVKMAGDGGGIVG